MHAPVLLNNRRNFYTNSDFLINRLEEIINRVDAMQPDIVIVTEVLPKQHFNN